MQGLLAYTARVGGNAKIGFFDSGIGGLSVLWEAARILPSGQSYVYLSDKEFAPYGDKPPEYIIKRADACVGELIARGCGIIVVACNTATGAAIEVLRQKYSLPIVGTEPALMPAVRECGQERILVLATPSCAGCFSTPSTDKKNLRGLVDKLNAEGHDIIISPQRGLAALIEENPHKSDVLREASRRILDSHSDVCAIVLGCTHYVYLRPYFDELTRGKVKLFDGNRGVAMRLSSMLEQGSARDN